MGEAAPLIPPKNGGGGSGSSNDDDEKEEEEEEEVHFKALKDRTWSFASRRQAATAAGTSLNNGSAPPPVMSSSPNRPGMQSPMRSPMRSPKIGRKQSDASTAPSLPDSGGGGFKGFGHYLYCLIYATVNVIIAVPSLFGYAAVIFNNPIYSSHMNALSKLLIFSSLIHQLGFLVFSTLPFAIGTVQDAGLIFLSTMANTIANTMIDDGHTQDEILSTTLALLCSGTALLGLVLVAMGYFKLADAVSYLPMPVVGGYLAFIGYFCVQAGTSLCISQPMMSIVDWNVMLDPRNLLLGGPGLLAGLLLTLTSRMATNSGVLPMVMVVIPVVFYIVLWACGTSLGEARDLGWVGETSPSVPVSDLLHLIDFKQVRWDLIGDILPTWFGMVFVVSFASCLDVAAISIDMGQPLETNKELATVGICNFMSGISLGFTGSYIFSQTIFTYRTGIHDRMIGAIIMAVYGYIVVSPINILEVAPLFFLGSCLIFIGYDLMYEWLWEVRHQVFMSEYFIVWFTFVSIHVVGIDFGILVGVLIAICDQIFTTAQSSGVNRITKRSRAIYTPEDAKVVQENAYSLFAPKIVTLEVIGNLFFGSSLNMLNRIYEETGMLVDENAVEDEPAQDHLELNPLVEGHHTPKMTNPPLYICLDLMHVTHLDASATRGCFLQLVKKAATKNIIVCASGLSPKLEWMFRAHDVSYKTAGEEEEAKAKLLSAKKKSDAKKVEEILIFVSVAEALEFCETLLLRKMTGKFKSKTSYGPFRNDALINESNAHTIGSVLCNFLRSNREEAQIFDRLTNLRYHSEVNYNAGQNVFSKQSSPDAFYIVLNGCVANSTTSNFHALRQQAPVISGAGRVAPRQDSSSTKRFCQSGSGKVVATLWQVGAIFGFNDFLLDRPRTFQTVAQVNGTILAKFTHSGMSTLQTQDPELYALMQKVLLRASNLDLANCTCHDV